MDDFDKGVIVALEELAELFEGIKDTELWKQYKGDESND
jgi:hypothetical protein